jgi:hypothetical protein
MGKTIPFATETGKGKCPKKLPRGFGLTEVRGVIPAVVADPDACALQRARVNTPATTTRNITKYSIELGPPSWPTFTGRANGVAVILTLQLKQLQGSGGSGVGATRRGHGRLNYWRPSASSWSC